MDADREVAPSPDRLRRAWAAGLRPASRWLAAGVSCVSLALALPSRGRLPDLAPVRQALAARGRADLDVLIPILRGGVALAALLALVFLAAATVATVVRGGAGPIRRGEAQRLNPAPLRPATLPLMLIALAVGIWAVVDRAGVLAAAARGAAASPESLAALWSDWATELLVPLGLALCAAGIAELLLARRAIVRALYLSIAEARHDARMRGPGRRPST